MRTFSDPPTALLQRYLLVSLHRLERVKRVDANKFKYEFKCPFCGDGKKSKFSTRGGLYERDGKIYFHCYNCQVNKSGMGFLKAIDPDSFKAVRLEALKDGSQAVSKPEPVHEPAKPVETVARRSLSGLRGIEELPPSHPARTYIEKRQIPKERWSDIFYTDTFYAYINGVLPDKFGPEALKHDIPRIVLPFIDADGHYFGCQGRVIRAEDSPRYISIMFEQQPKIFGQHHVDTEQEMLIVEGPLDSLFLSNALAMAGADVPVSLDKLRTTLVFDNEPRNQEIVRLMHKYLSQGHRVCVWPKGLPGKDINDLVLNGYAPAEIEALIHANTYTGARGQYALASWKRTT